MIRHDIDIIENGRQIHEKHGKDAIEVRHIPEKDLKGGNNKAYTYIKGHQAADREYEHQKFPCKGYVIEEYKDEENTEGKEEINEG